MNAFVNCYRRTWNWIKTRLLALWKLICWLADCIFCCSCCIDDDGNDIEKGISHIHTSDIHQSNIGDGHKKSTTMDNAGGAANGQVHKVIMVGSGGVGK